MADASAGEWAPLDAAIDDDAETAFSFLQRLIAAPSTVGSEQGAQEVVAAELARLGFDVTELEVPAQTAAGAPGGVAQVSYAGRHNVLGRMNQGSSPCLLLNGHVDVVPAETELWSSDPFVPVRSDGWLVGRGAEDMKGGFALGLLAIAALRRIRPEALSGEIAFLSVIEEECTGNGTLAAGNAGIVGDAVILLEPTDLHLLHGGVGPALAYGPRARHIHAVDEAVELASIVSGAKALARFIAGYFASGGLAGLDAAQDGAAR